MHDDNDDDGIPGADDQDDDGYGIPDTAKVADADGDGVSDDKDLDDDNNGVPDTGAADDDDDGDGISNADENFRNLLCNRIRSAILLLVLAQLPSCERESQPICRACWFRWFRQQIRILSTTLPPSTLA